MFILNWLHWIVVCEAWQECVDHGFGKRVGRSSWCNAMTHHNVATLQANNYFDIIIVFCVVSDLIARACSEEGLTISTNVCDSYFIRWLRLRDARLTCEGLTPAKLQSWAVLIVFHWTLKLLLNILVGDFIFYFFFNLALVPASPCPLEWPLHCSYAIGVQKLFWVNKHSVASHV